MKLNEYMNNNIDENKTSIFENTVSDGIEKNNDVLKKDEVLIENDMSLESEMSEEKSISINDETLAEEEIIMLSTADLKTIVSCLLLIVFIIAMIYEISRPESLMATVIMLISFIVFIIIALTDRD